MSSEENKAIVGRLWEEYFERRNVAVLEELISSEYVVYQAEAWWRPDRLRGRACVERYMSVWWGAFPDISFLVEEMIAEGDRVLTIASGIGTHEGDFPWGPSGVVRPTGKQMSYLTMIVSRIADGKIVEDWESFNMASIWRQLGVVPPWPGHDLPRPR